MFRCFQQSVMVAEVVEEATPRKPAEVVPDIGPTLLRPTLLGPKAAGVRKKASRGPKGKPTYAHKWTEAVDKYASMDAVIFDGVGPEHHFTYLDLEISANRLARNLTSMGLQAGDRIVTIAENRPEMVALILASAKLGLTFVPLATDLRVRDCHAMVEQYNPGLIVCDQPQYFPFLRAGGVQYRSMSLPAYAEGGNELKTMMAEGNSRPVDEASVPAGAASLIFSTSGSTAACKGVMYSPEHVLELTSFGGDLFNPLGSKPPDLLKVRQVMGSSAFGQWCLTMRTKHLMWAPMRGVAGTMLLLKHLLDGTLTVMADASSGPELWAKLIEKHSITSHMLFGAAMNRTLQEMPDRKFPSVKTVSYSGSCFSPALIQRSMAQFPNASFVQVYGMTEVHPISVLGPECHKRVADASAQDLARMASAGRPLNVDDVFIEDLDQPGSGKSPPLEKNRVGQICARSTITMMGYYSDPEKTRQAMPDGKFVRTGDVGRIDEDGFLHILGRIKDVIPAYKGFNVVPRDIEEVLYAHPEVGQACVCGTPHPSGAGEAVVAWVQARNGSRLTAGELRRHCQESGMPSWQTPDAIHVSERQLPTIGGKIDCKELRAASWMQEALAETLARAEAGPGAGRLESPVGAGRSGPDALASEFSELIEGDVSDAKLEAALRETLPQAKGALQQGVPKEGLMALLGNMTSEERGFFVLCAKSLLKSWAARKV